MRKAELIIICILVAASINCGKQQEDLKRTDGRDNLRTSEGVETLPVDYTPEVKLEIKNSGHDGRVFFVDYLIINESDHNIKVLRLGAIWKNANSKELLQESSQVLLTSLDPPMKKGDSKSGKFMFFPPTAELSEISVDLAAKINDGDWYLLEGNMQLSTAEADEIEVPDKIADKLEPTLAIDIKEAGYDGRKFLIEYSITNNTQREIGDLRVKAIWSASVTDEAIDETARYLIWPGSVPLKPGQTKFGDLAYFPSSKDISILWADVYASIEDEDWQLVKENLNLSIPSVKSNIRFEVLSTSYERSMARNLSSYIYEGRVDFKISNISNEPIERLVVKTVWYKKGTKEIFGEDQSYIVSDSDIPLKPGYSKADYHTSGRGYKYDYPYLTVDIYVSRHIDKYEIVRKGMLIE